MSPRVEAKCVRCGRDYRLPLESAGRRVKCKSCGAVFTVPVPEKSLDDTVLAWLAEAEAAEEDFVPPPRMTTARELSREEASSASGGLRAAASQASGERKPLR